MQTGPRGQREALFLGGHMQVLALSLQRPALSRALRLQRPVSMLNEQQRIVTQQLLSKESRRRCRPQRRLSRLTTAVIGVVVPAIGVVDPAIGSLLLRSGSLLLLRSSSFIGSVVSSSASPCPLPSRTDIRAAASSSSRAFFSISRCVYTASR